MGGSVKTLLSNGLVDLMALKRLRDNLIHFDPETRKSSQVYKPGFETKCMHCACVIYKGSIISFGINKFRGAPVDFCDHAECNAIQNLPPRLKNRGKNKNCDLIKIDLVVTRQSRTLQLGMSRPCLRCISYINIFAPKRGYKIKNVFYTNEQGEIEKHCLTDLEDMPHPNGNIKKPLFLGPHSKFEQQQQQQQYREQRLDTDIKIR